MLSKIKPGLQNWLKTYNKTGNQTCIVVYITKGGA